MATDKIRVTARIEPELYNKFVRTSERLRVSQSLLLEQALSNYLGQDSLVLKRKRNGNGRAR